MKRQEWPRHSKIDFKMGQAMSRHWRRYLNKIEYLVLSYIVDRSVGWGKGCLTACADDVLNGNTDYQAPVLETLDAYLKKLKTAKEQHDKQEAALKTLGDAAAGMVAIDFPEAAWTKMNDENRLLSPALTKPFRHVLTAANAMSSTLPSQYLQAAETVYLPASFRPIKALNCSK